MVSEATFTHRAVAAAAPGEVWNALQDAATWLDLGVMDTVSNTVVAGGRLESFEWTAPVGGMRRRGTARTIDAVPDKRMVLALHSSEVAGEISVDLSAAQSGTSVAVTLAARPRGLLAGMFWGQISQALGRGLPGNVDRFVARF